MAVPQPWSTSQATETIRRLAQGEKLDLSYSKHARERMEQRDLLISDILYVLKRGFVHRTAEKSTQPGLYKYRIESRTPNSNNRGVAVVVIPDEVKCWIKVVTVMWDDD